MIFDQKRNVDSWQQVGGTSELVAPGSYSTGLTSMGNM